MYDPLEKANATIRSSTHEQACSALLLVELVITNPNCQKSSAATFLSIFTWACVFASLYMYLLMYRYATFSFCGHMTCWHGYIWNLFISLSSPNSFVPIYGLLLSQFLCKLYWILFSIDASKSSKRKAARGMSTPQYTYCVARTTFRGQICLYWCFFSLYI